MSIGAGTVPVKDLYRDECAEKSINSSIREQQENAANTVALRRIGKENRNS